MRIKMNLDEALIECYEKNNEGYPKYEKWKRKLVTHSEIVREVAIELCDALNINGNDRDLIGTAAYLHDIKKYKKGEKKPYHNESGAMYVAKNCDRFFDYIDEDEEELELICLMIKWHKGKGYKERKYSSKQILMIEVVRAADKISKLYKSKKSFAKTCESIEKKLEKLMDKEVKKHAMDIFKNRKEAEKVRKQKLIEEIFGFKNCSK